MHYIHITEFVNWKEEQVLDYLQKNTTGNDFELSIPKSTRLFFDDYDDIAIDYLRAAYVGQQLAGITGHFSYTSIDPQTNEHISFTLQGVEPEALAAAICAVSPGFGTGEGNEALAFNEGVSTFLDELLANNIVPACPYFVAIYNEFASEDADADLFGEEDTDM